MPPRWSRRLPYGVVPGENAKVAEGERVYPKRWVTHRPPQGVSEASLFGPAHDRSSSPLTLDSLHKCFGCCRDVEWPSAFGGPHQSPAGVAPVLPFEIARGQMTRNRTVGIEQGIHAV